MNFDIYLKHNKAGEDKWFPVVRDVTEDELEALLASARKSAASTGSQSFFAPAGASERALRCIVYGTELVSLCEGLEPGDAKLVDNFYEFVAQHDLEVLV